MLSLFLFFISCRDEEPDPIYGREMFTLTSKTYQLLQKRAFFFFENKNLKNVTLHIGMKKHNISKPAFYASGDVVDFSSKTETKFRYSYWFLEENECKGLNYAVFTHYGMNLEMKNVKHSETICLFMPYYAVSINVSNKEDITSIYKKGTRKKIDPSEINTFENPYNYPLVIVIPPSEKRTISFKFVAEEPSTDNYCGVTPLESFDKNEEALFKYKIPFEVTCFEKGNIKIKKVLNASIVAAISGVLLFILYYYPYFCGSKPEN